MTTTKNILKNLSQTLLLAAIAVGFAALPFAPAFTSTAQAAPSNVEKLVINEIHVEGDSDWVEIYNPGPSSVGAGEANRLSIHDSTGHVIDLPNNVINSDSYVVLEVNDRLNNAGDKVELIYSNPGRSGGDEEIDSVAYGSGESLGVPDSGETLSRIPNGSGDFESAPPTKDANNDPDNEDNGDDTNDSVDYCDPSERPAGMSIADWLAAGEESGADCFEPVVVENQCGSLDVKLSDNVLFEGIGDYSFHYVIDGETPTSDAEWAGDGPLPVEFDEDEYGGSVDVTYYVTGPEGDYFIGSGIPNFWDGNGATVTVDTDCEDDAPDEGATNKDFECSGWNCINKDGDEGKEQLHKNFETTSRFGGTGWNNAIKNPDADDITNDNNSWSDEESRDFELSYNPGDGQVAYTVEGTDLTYTYDVGKAFGAIALVAKGGERDGSVYVQNIDINGTGYGDVYAATDYHGIHVPLSDGQQQSGFTMTGTATFDWPDGREIGQGSDEVPGFQIFALDTHPLETKEPEALSCEPDELYHIKTEVDEGSDLVRINSSGSQDTLGNYPESFDNLAVHPDTRDFYALEGAAGDKELVTLNDDGSTNHEATVEGLGKVVAMGFGPDGTLYVGDQTSGEFYEVNLSTGATSLVSDLGNDLGGGDLVVSEDGDIVYVSGNGAVYRFDGSSWEEFDTGLTGSSYSSLAYTSDGNYYAYSRDNDEISVFEITDTGDGDDVNQLNSENVLTDVHYGDGASCLPIVDPISPQSCSEEEEILHLDTDDDSATKGHLLRVDPSDGSTTVVGDYSDTEFTATLADYDGTLYSITTDMDLVTLGAAGSVSNVVPVNGLSNPVALDFATDGTLYVADQAADAVFELDPSDGSTNKLADLDVNGGDLVVGPENILYVHKDGRLFEIHRGSGAVAQDKELSPDPDHITSATYDDGVYYALDRDDTLYKFVFAGGFSVTYDDDAPEGSHYSYGDATCGEAPEGEVLGQQQCKADILHLATDDAGTLFSVDESDGSTTVLQNYDGDFHSVLADDDGKLYSIRKDGMLVTLGGDNTVSDVGDTQDLVKPVAMDFAADGTLYVLDQVTDEIHVIDPSNGNQVSKSAIYNTDDEENLDVTGGDLISIVDDNEVKLIYVHKDGTVYKLDPSTAPVEAEVIGEIDDATHITSATEREGKYYAFDRDDLNDKTDGTMYVFEIDPFSVSVVESDTGPYQYGDATCATAPVDEEIGQCEATDLEIVSDDQTKVGDGNATSTLQHENWDADTLAVFDGAEWIWESSTVSDPVGTTTVTFTRDFNYNGNNATSAMLHIATDNSYAVSLNGDIVGSDSSENNYTTETYDSHDVSSQLQTGSNTLTITVKNWQQDGGTTESNPAGLLYKLTIDGEICPVDDTDDDPDDNNDDDRQVSTLSGGGGGGLASSNSSNGNRQVFLGGTDSNDDGESDEEVLGVQTESCDPYLNDYLHADANNDPLEVLKLQIFLSGWMGFDDVSLTGTYDSATEQAVRDFQSHYAEDVLAPWNISEPTGYVYKTTRGKINSLLCNEIPFGPFSNLQPDLDVTDQE